MKRSTKIILIVSVAVMLLGLVIAFSAFAAMNFDIIKLEGVQWIPKSQVVTEDFSEIYVVTDSCDIKILPTDGECRVDFSGNDKVSCEIDVKNSTLVVKYIDNRRWYENVGIYWHNSYVTVYLPEDQYTSILLSSKSGDIYTSSGIITKTAKAESTSGEINFRGQVYNDLTLTSTSGDIELSKPQAIDLDGTALRTARIKVKTTSGDISMDHIDARSVSAETTSGEIEAEWVEGVEIYFNTTSGDQELSYIVSTGKLNVTSVSGELELESCDGSKVTLKTTSGDIEAKLISPKVFTVRAISGNARYPDSDKNGGTCHAESTSGNIRITVK